MWTSVRNVLFWISSRSSCLKNYETNDKSMKRWRIDRPRVIDAPLYFRLISKIETSTIECVMLIFFYASKTYCLLKKPVRVVWSTGDLLFNLNFIKIKFPSLNRYLTFWEHKPFLIVVNFCLVSCKKSYVLWILRLSLE